MAIFGEEPETCYWDQDWSIDPFDDRSWVRTLVLLVVAALVMWIAFRGSRPVGSGREVWAAPDSYTAI